MVTLVAQVWRMDVGWLLSFSRTVDRLSTRVGRVVAWAILIAVVVSAVNAIIRKVFNTSSNSWLELQWISFGAVFLLCCAVDTAVQRAYPHRYC